jgi:transcriptional regulator GlxA family with amidase domain
MNSKLNHIQNWPELAKETNWSAAKLAKLCGVSVRTLRRHMLKESGETTKSWLAEERRHHMLQLVRDGAPLKTVSSTLGFKHPTNFSRYFKNSFGVCPSHQLPPSNPNQPENVRK